MVTDISNLLCVFCFSFFDYAFETSSMCQNDTEPIVEPYVTYLRCLSENSMCQWAIMLEPSDTFFMGSNNFLLKIHAHTNPLGPES